MSIIELGSAVKKKKESGQPMIKEALEIIDYAGVDKVHDKLGKRYFQGINVLKGIKEARYSIGLVLALDQEEYYGFVERIFELDYALDLFYTVYKDTQRNDVLGNAICLTFLPKIAEIVDWVDDLFKEIGARWDEGRDLNLEVSSLFIQICDKLGIEEQEIQVDYEELLKNSRSTARYIVAELVNDKLVISSYNEKGEALRAIMGSRTLTMGNLITRY